MRDKQVDTIYHISIGKGDRESNLEECKLILEREYSDNDLVYVYYNEEDIVGNGYLSSYLSDLGVYSVEYGGRLGYDKRGGVDSVDNYLRVVLGNRGSKHRVLNYVLDIDFYFNILRGMYGIDVRREIHSDGISLTVGDLGCISSRSIEWIIDDEVVKGIKYVVSKSERVVLYDSENISRISLVGKGSKLVKGLRGEGTGHIVVGTEKVIDWGRGYRSINNALNCKRKLRNELGIVDRVKVVDIDLGISLVKEISDKVISLIGLYAKERGKVVLVISRDKYFIGLSDIYGKEIVDKYSMYITYSILAGYGGELNSGKVGREAKVERCSYIKYLRLSGVGVDLGYYDALGVDFSEIVSGYSELGQIKGLNIG